mmetsp:Transcript_9381/g.25112  ORF Transcript_9381/g.25112 Transcript_9381/m.25112 type:complete len:228 (+) Transcript_9381:4148-4831(+)
MAFSRIFRGGDRDANLFNTRNSLRVRSAFKPPGLPPFREITSSTTETITTTPSKHVVGFLRYPLRPRAVSSRAISTMKMRRKTYPMYLLGRSKGISGGNFSIIMMTTLPAMINMMKNPKTSFFVIHRAARTGAQSNHGSSSNVLSSSSSSSTCPSSTAMPSASSFLLMPSLSVSSSSFAAPSSSSFSKSSRASSTTARATFRRKWELMMISKKKYNQLNATFIPSAV